MRDKRDKREDLENLKRILSEINNDNPPPTKLNLSFSDFLQREDYNRLVKAIIRKNTPLESIDFTSCGNRMGSNNLFSILDQNKTVKNLNLFNNLMGDKECDKFSRALIDNKTLENLNLGGNNIGPKGINLLALIIKNNSTLKSFNLELNNIDDDAAGLLGNALKANKALESFNLESNKIQANGAGLLGDALKANKALKIFNLGCNEIGNEGAKLLGDGLKVNTALKSLYLHKNDIGDEGVNDLTLSLAKNTTLKELNLANNIIGVKGAKDIATILANDCNLTSLDLSNNKIGDEGAKFLASALRYNTNLRNLNIDGNGIGAEGMKALALALKENITLKDFHLKCDYTSYDHKSYEALETIRLRNEKFPSNITEIIAEKIYQSFEQKKQGHINTSKQPLLDSTESSLIAISPNSCIRILKELLKKDGISERDRETLFNHIKEFDSTGVSGSRILLSSLKSEELESFFNLENTLSLTELFSATGVTKNLGSKEVEEKLPSTLNEMGRRELSAIFKQLSGHNTHPLGHSILSNGPHSNSRD